MSKIEKIQAYIERLMEENNNNPNVYDFGRERACVLIKSFIDSLLKEPVSEDLEEEIERFSIQPESKHYKQTARHFAQWQKEQMMAKAVEGEILEIEDNDCAMCSHTHLELFVEPNTLEKKGFKDKDKVKVIVIKEG